MRVGDLHLGPERGVGVVVASFQLQRGVKNAVEFIEGGNIRPRGAVEASEANEGCRSFGVVGEVREELLVNHDRLGGLLLFFLELQPHAQHRIALAGGRRAESHELCEKFFRKGRVAHFQRLLDFDLHAFDARSLANAVPAQPQVLLEFCFQGFKSNRGGDGGGVHLVGEARGLGGRGIEFLHRRCRRRGVFTDRGRGGDFGLGNGRDGE